MEVIINGEGREIPTGTSLLQLIELLSLNSQRLAVELNREIVRRQDWPSQILNAGDKLEIVHFVGGG